MSSSKEYWKQREAEALKKYLLSEQEYEKEIRKIYNYLLGQIQKEINGFYTKYASSEGLSLADAKLAVAKADIAYFEQKAAKYVAEKDFSDTANEEMKLYNATMKINRLEMLKADIGLEMVSSFDELQKYFDQILTERTLEEFERQAGILGKTIQNNSKFAKAIVNASFKNATYSDRIWMYQSQMKAELSKLLQEGLIQGRNPKQLATYLQKTLGASRIDAERLMRTELARVQTEAQKQSFEEYGFEEYQFNAILTACKDCLELDGQHFKVVDMMPGTNAPPMHPNCRCSTSGYSDEKLFDEWVNSYQEHGLSYEDWKNNLA